MARPSKHYWTAERLRELEASFHVRSPSWLVQHFGKPYNLLCQAYDHAKLHRKLKIKSKKRGRGRHTVYAPGYAEGAEPPPLFGGERLV